MSNKKLDSTSISWDELLPLVLTLTEAELLKLLASEKKNKARVFVMLRIHSRYNVLRAKRERQELMK